MKYQISKAEFDALDDAIKALYEASDDGYKLKVEGLPEQEDVSGLKSQVERLMDEKKEASRRAHEAEQARIERDKQAAKEKGDFEQLYQSSQQELEQARKQYADLVSLNERSKIKSEAYKLASGIAEGVNAEILAEFLERRLKVSEGEIRVLNDKGELTVSSLESLADEFKKNPRYASLVRGTQSNGGGAAGPGNGVPSDKQPHEYTGAERSELLRSDPAKFNEIFGKQGA